MRCATVLGVIVRARIPIGPDGRNRPSLFPFGTATGRNAQAKSLFNAHAIMRSFMKFPPDKIGLYLDWRTQEVGIAAARSGDVRLAEDYLAGDIYHALAVMCGLTNQDAKSWKASREGKIQRQRMKPLQLGINYGMGVMSLSRGLGRHPLIGSEVIIRHQQRYPTYWAWRAGDGRARHAGAHDRVRIRRLAAAHLDTRRTSARSTIFRCKPAAPRCCGWRPIDCATPAWCRACWCMTASCSSWTTRSRSSTPSRSCGWPAREVCGGLEIGVDEDQKLIGGARYRDKRPVAKQMWEVVMDVLRKIGALSAEAG